MDYHTLVNIVHGIGVLPGSFCGQDKTPIIRKPYISGVRILMLASKFVSIKAFFTWFLKNTFEMRTAFLGIPEVNSGLKKKMRSLCLEAEKWPYSTATCLLTFIPWMYGWYTFYKCVKWPVPKMSLILQKWDAIPWTTSHWHNYRIYSDILLKKVILNLFLIIFYPVSYLNCSTC